jgi:glycolate oxidase iron-sulfur subunit
MSHEQKDLLELTTHCIRCGFCLEDCPTFKITGAEPESPRGRIYLIRSAIEGKLDWAKDVQPHMDKCLGCRACETACPSGVEYGSIFELAKEKLAEVAPSPTRAMLLKGLTNPKLANIQFQLTKFLPGGKLPGFVNQMVSRDGSAEANVPKPNPVRNLPDLVESTLPPIKGEVALLLGCVMRVLYPNVHACTVRLLRRIGYRVVEIHSPCCGALHAHSGLLDDARSRANQLVSSVPEGIPVLVNSAGCGSTMKEYGQLDPKLQPFGERVLDVSEFLLANGLREQLGIAKGLDASVTYHDACHLVHGQGISSQPRELIKAIPGIRFIELEEASTCCGSAGIYNVQEPKMARRLLDRKWGFIAQTDAHIVATGNPGCHAWIAQAAQETGGNVQVLHTIELLEYAFSGIPK